MRVVHYVGDRAISVAAILYHSILYHTIPIANLAHWTDVTSMGSMEGSMEDWLCSSVLWDSFVL